MLVLHLSHLVTFLTLFNLTLTHPLANQVEQHNDITALEPRRPSQPLFGLTVSKPHSRLLSRRNLFIEGYRLSLFQQFQILPISLAASELRDFWTGVMVAADAKWQTDDRILLQSFGGLQILFESGDENVPLDWTAIVFLASYMKDRVGVGGGWVGFFQGTMTNLVTQTVIRVTLQYTGQVL